ncbi:MAG: HAD family phosphatase [Clostridia bacterium]|nr:HAD family phosphatase [Clostridia bacterium]
MKKTIKGIIFDLDGTLLLSMHVWDTIGSTYLRSLGIDPDPDTDDIIKVSTLEEAADYFCRRYALSVTPEEIRRAVNDELTYQYHQVLLPKEGVMAMLESFKKAGVKMFAATATDRHLIEPCLKRCGIYDYLEGMLTCTEVGEGKNKPTIYRLATEKLGIPKENIAVFEDALYAARTAKGDGYFLVGIYDDSMKNYQDKIKALADLYVPDYLSVDVVKELLGKYDSVQ